jgi:hypothetical protein
MNNPPMAALQHPAVRKDMMTWRNHCGSLTGTDEELTLKRLEGDAHLQALAPRKIPDLYTLACEDKKRDGPANYTITSGLSCKTLHLASTTRGFFLTV